MWHSLDCPCARCDDDRATIASWAAPAVVADTHREPAAPAEHHRENEGQPRRSDLPRIEAWLADRYGWSNLRAQVDAALGDPVSARRHTRNANRALVGLRVVRAALRGAARIGHILNVARESVAGELRS